MMYKTQAVKRLETFFETNYERMYRIAVQEVGEHSAWDVVNNTYLSLMEKEERGRGQYNESYGTKYESYIYGALYGTIKGMRKVLPEISESCLVTYNTEGELTPSYLDNVGTYDNISDVIDSTVCSMEICTEFVAVCDSCSTDVVALVRAIKQPDNLNASFLSVFFASLRKASKADCNVVTAVEEFIRIYGARPQEVDQCLMELGVYTS